MFIYQGDCPATVRKCVGLNLAKNRPNIQRLSYVWDFASFGQSPALAKIKHRMRIQHRRRAGVWTRHHLIYVAKSKPSPVNHVGGPKTRARRGPEQWALVLSSYIMYSYLLCKQFLRRRFSLSFASKLRFMFDNIFRKLPKKYDTE